MKYSSMLTVGGLFIGYVHQINITFFTGNMTTLLSVAVQLICSRNGKLGNTSLT